MRIKDPRELKELANEIRESEKPKKTQLIVSTKATCCYLNGSEAVAQALEKAIKKAGLENDVELLTTGCLGFCQVEPIVIVRPQGIFYADVEPKHAEDIVSKTVMNGEVIEDILYTDPGTGERIENEKDIPFYRKQERVVLGNNEKIDPTKSEDYLKVGGYDSLSRVLSSMSPEDVIKVVKDSGLRGRGGAGFPTGLKWEFARGAESDEKYIVCNADEGDPGAYMDRSILESNPHSVLEGMIIGAYSTGAHHGYIYVRNEYPLAVKHITKAIREATELGLLGEDIMGSGFDFEIKISKGAGAFVCGEETALIASVEGKRGTPRPKPPFPAQRGLFGESTNINNVETWSNVPLIIEGGSEWYSGIGTESSKGTKIFSLVGKVQNTGLVEVPMGTTIQEIVYDIGGGSPKGKDVKAIQIGGPSGGCIPQKLFHLPIDYQSLTEAGAILGSGGLIVMDEDTCMVDVARYFTNFLQEESCGKCTFCRLGTKRMWEILDRITCGKGSRRDLDLLRELAPKVKEGALCGLGQTAPNPIMTTLRYFEDEYHAHVDEQTCPSGQCKALIEYLIDPDKCTGCHACAVMCPADAIEGQVKEPHKIDPKKCTKCGSCYETCKFDAINFVKSEGGD